MEGTKIKNIVIIILLLLNGFLLVPVGGRRAQNADSRDAALNSAVEILRNSGVILADDAIPGEPSLPVLQAVRDLTLEREQAVRLLGSGVSVQARGGEIYRYESELGWLQSHSTGEFLAEFAPDVFPAGEDAVKQGMRLLAALDFEAELREQSEERLVFEQRINGIRVPGCQAVLVCRDGAIVAIEDGRRVPGTLQGGTQQAVVSAATALMRLYNGLNELGDIYNQIQTIEPAYRLSVNLSEPARLTPIWHVTTDTGVYQMEIRSGQVSRAGDAAVPAAQMDEQDETPG